MSIKVIHLGVGGRGKHWLEFVAQHPDFESVACVDKDEKALETVRSFPGQEHGGFYSEFEDALSHIRPEAAIIASPSFLHAQHANLAIGANLAVFVEKPLACNLREAVMLVERARAAECPLMVAENYRFFQAERTLRRMLDEQIAGRLSSAVCIDRRDQPSHAQGPWVQSMDHPFLVEIAVHHFDSFRYFFNRQPVSLFTKCYNPYGSDYHQYAAAEALIEMENGFSIIYMGTFIANRYEYSLWVEGEKGDIWTDRKRVWWRPKGKRFFRPVKLAPMPEGEGSRYPKAGTVSLLNQFRDMLVSGKPSETSGEKNLWTLAMMDAAILSDREKRKVQIDEVFTSALKSQAGVAAD